MTNYQLRTIWELCRQGLQMSAYDAERCWEHGDMYHLDYDVKVPRLIKSLIECSNRDVQQIARPV